MTMIIFLNQQFITQRMRANHGSYFITMYIEPKPTGKKREKKRNRKEIIDNKTCYAKCETK